MLARRDVILSMLATAVATPSQSQTAADPPSRGQLFAAFVRPVGLAESENGPDAGKPLAIPPVFKFPGDAQNDTILKQPRLNAIFGADISGWTDINVPLADMRLQRVRFIYSKASQGTTYKDKKFATFWSKLGALQGEDKPWRGAYHFLSSSSPGLAQADAFLSAMDSQGGLQPGDMSPAVDLEWDVVTQNGPDQWIGKGKSYILDTALGCLHRIKARTGRTPVLYTAKSWFSNQTVPLADFDNFKEFPLWVADYRPKQKLEENPDYPGGARPALWQFTDSAQLTSGYSAGLDASIFNGTEADFRKTFQIS